MEGGLLLGEIHLRLQPARLGEAGADGGPGDSRRLPCAGAWRSPKGLDFPCGVPWHAHPACASCAQPVLWTPPGCSLPTPGRA